MDKILVVFGEGGHAEQMKRLCAILAVPNHAAIAVVDQKGLGLALAEKEIVISPMRRKYTNSMLSYAAAFLSNFFSITKLLWLEKPKAMVSTGPGICVIPALLMWVMRREVIYIETWSRFYTKSLTGAAMYRIATRFYIQNMELQKLYPKAVYCGRL